MSSTELDTRTRILKETWRLMESQRGLAVHIRDIARAAGISRQAVYLHFGSRSDLLIATVRFVDAAKGIEDRLRPIYQAVNGIASLDAFVEFWGNYIPEIYGLVKALLVMVETDPDAAAAFDDRMNAVRDGCRQVIDCLVRSELLAPEWDTAEAIDLMWSMLSVEQWEKLTRACGWSNEQYIQRMQIALKQLFVR